MTALNVLFNDVIMKLWGLKFLQWCYWRFKSSGMLHCAIW